MMADLLFQSSNLFGQSFWLKSAFAYWARTHMALTLYHATSDFAAHGIDREGFRCGNHGFAGGAIYFSQSSQAACRKYRNGRGNPDILIQCRVTLGRVLEAVQNTVNENSVRRRGFDSATWMNWFSQCENPGELVFFVGFVS